MKSLWKLRYELYTQVRRHVEQLLGEESVGMRKYRENFEKSFYKRWKPIQRVAFLHKLRVSRVVLLADFHAHHQSQKAQIRLLKNIKNKKVILGVEFLESKDQALIESYMKGDLSEEKFLEKVKWDQRWGFPFSHYRPILDWARRSGVRVLGINKYYKERSSRTLKSRDSHSAQVISQILQEDTNSQVWIIYGDWHLAQHHLPREIIKQCDMVEKKDIVTVFQNSEKIFFQAMKQDRDHDLDVVQLSNQEYCLMSVPPWVKWQSYLQFLESELDLEGEGEEQDYTDHISQYVQILGQDLQVQVDQDSVSVYAPGDESFFEKINNVFSAKDARVLLSLIQREMSFYCPECDMAFLSRPSVNHASSLAMDIVHAQLSKRDCTPLHFPEDFQLAIFLEAIRYFGSKLINPKRKTDTLMDVRMTLESQFPGDHGREAMQLAIAEKMREMIYVTSGTLRGTSFLARHKSSYFGAARLLGGMMGEKLYWGYREGRMSRRFIIQLLSHPLGPGSNFHSYYYELVHELDAIPEPFLSKTEKL
ncbi:MAG: hypothetical protein BroJett040_12480 [Oligoflexia bacterium]|nr:MAG: hypothetical protein BroJett040_12480 [Oligoflexia bacterium]